MEVTKEALHVIASHRSLGLPRDCALPTSVEALLHTLRAPELDTHLTCLLAVGVDLLSEGWKVDQRMLKDCFTGLQQRNNSNSGPSVCDLSSKSIRLLRNLAAVKQLPALLSFCETNADTLALLGAGLEKALQLKVAKPRNPHYESSLTRDMADDAAFFLHSLNLFFEEQTSTRTLEQLRHQLHPLTSQRSLTQAAIQRLFRTLNLYASSPTAFTSQIARALTSADGCYTHNGRIQLEHLLKQVEFGTHAASAVNFLMHEQDQQQCSQQQQEQQQQVQQEVQQHGQGQQQQIQVTGQQLGQGQQGPGLIDGPGQGQVGQVVKQEGQEGPRSLQQPVAANPLVHVPMPAPCQLKELASCIAMIMPPLAACVCLSHQLHHMGCTAASALEEAEPPLSSAQQTPEQALLAVRLDLRDEFCSYLLLALDALTLSAGGAAAASALAVKGPRGGSRPTLHRKALATVLAAIAQSQWGPPADQGLVLSQLLANPAGNIEVKAAPPPLSAVCQLLQPACMGADVSSRAAVVMSRLFLHDLHVAQQAAGELNKVIAEWPSDPVKQSVTKWAYFGRLGRQEQAAVVAARLIKSLVELVSEHGVIAACMALISEARSLDHVTNAAELIHNLSDWLLNVRTKGHRNLWEHGGPADQVQQQLSAANVKALVNAAQLGGDEHLLTLCPKLKLEEGPVTAKDLASVRATLIRLGNTLQRMRLPPGPALEVAGEIHIECSDSEMDMDMCTSGLSDTCKPEGDAEQQGPGGVGARAMGGRGIGIPHHTRSRTQMETDASDPAHTPPARYSRRSSSHHKNVAIGQEKRRRVVSERAAGQPASAPGVSSLRLAATRGANPGAQGRRGRGGRSRSDLPHAVTASVQQGPGDGTGPAIDTTSSRLPTSTAKRSTVEIQPPVTPVAQSSVPHASQLMLSQLVAPPPSDLAAVPLPVPALLRAEHQTLVPMVALPSSSVAGIAASVQPAVPNPALQAFSVAAAAPPFPQLTAEQAVPEVIARAQPTLALAAFPVLSVTPTTMQSAAEQALAGCDTPVPPPTVMGTVPMLAPSVPLVDVPAPATAQPAAGHARLGVGVPAHMPAPAVFPAYAPAHTGNAAAAHSAGQASVPPIQALPLEHEPPAPVNQAPITGSIQHPVLQDRLDATKLQWQPNGNDLTRGGTAYLMAALHDAAQLVFWQPGVVDVSDRLGQHLRQQWIDVAAKAQLLDRISGPCGWKCLVNEYNLCQQRGSSKEGLRAILYGLVWPDL